ncbi:MAG: AMP-binding protein [Oscillospiraceae bacterium]|jgi:acetyl-CoA synthetase|nr:AMP-binding protein [Oscillospiraceae bacterium]
MPLYETYVGRHRDDFATLEDLRQNYKLSWPEDFNFAYDCLDKLAVDTPDARAMVWVSRNGEAREFTFADIKRLTDKTANWLSAQGVGKGDMVMLVLGRAYQFWYALLALHKLGAVAVPATTLLTQKDYVYRFNAGDIKMVLASGDGDVTRHIDAALPECPTVTLKAVIRRDAPEGGWLDFDRGVEAASETFVRPTPHNKATDLMLMAFSSGTTGYPKMVAHDFTYPLGHILTGCFWHRCVEGGLHFTISDTGWLKSLWGKLYGQWLGGSAVLVYDFDRFSAPDILDKVAAHHVTTFCAPPTMYRYIVKEELAHWDLSALRHVATAGEALNPEVYSNFYRQTGLKIFEGFGQTETTICCFTVAPWMQPRLGSMGLPCPGYDMVICDADGAEVSAGVTGEICIRADRTGGVKPAGMFSGYYRDPEATARAWHDGLYHTGDTAYRDEMGFLWYVGRVDDVIKSSGYRIGPFEVESALMEHPAVLECAVTGVPDPDRGFAVKATIVLGKGFEPSDELTRALQNHVKKVTAPYKYPRVVVYTDALPKTISGKIRRVEIREQDAQTEDRK